MFGIIVEHDFIFLLAPRVLFYLIVELVDESFARLLARDISDH